MEFLITSQESKCVSYVCLQYEHLFDATDKHD